MSFAVTHGCRPNVMDTLLSLWNFAPSQERGQWSGLMELVITLVTTASEEMHQLNSAIW